MTKYEMKVLRGTNLEDITGKANRFFEEVGENIAHVRAYFIPETDRKGGYQLVLLYSRYVGKS